MRNCPCNDSLAFRLSPLHHHHMTFDKMNAALEPDAFKALYPDLYYQRFVENGVRPDGRPFGSGRPLTIGPDAVGSTNASALIKLGSTTILAGVKLEVLVSDEAEIREGQLSVSVEVMPMSSTEMRPARTSDAADCLAEQVRQLLQSSKAIDLSKLAIPSGNTAWVAYLDIYVLDSDGCLLDACLLGAVSALASLKSLPSMTVTEDGQVIEAQGINGDEAMSEEGAGITGLVKKDCVPLALTCGLYKGKLIADPTAQEEKLMDCLMTVALDARGRILGFLMSGGNAEAGTVELQDCIAAAKLRYEEVIELLYAAIEG